MTTRLVAVQRWPVEAKAPKTVDSTARGDRHRRESPRILSAHLALGIFSSGGRLARRVRYHFVRAGERNGTHIGMLQQFVAYLAARADDHVEHAGRNPGLLEDLNYSRAVTE